MSRLVGAFLPIAKGVALGSVAAVEAGLLRGCLDCVGHDGWGSGAKGKLSRI